MASLQAQVEAALEARRARRHGDEIAFLCVAHEETNPSADWNRKKGTWHCMVCGAGGTTRDLAERLGIDVPPARPGGFVEPVAFWDFHDEQGNVLFRHVKFVEKGKKSFQFWRPNGHGGWIKNREGMKPVLYRLPDLARLKPGDMVFIVEGEKDADTLRARGFNATSTPDGAQERDKAGRPGKQRWYPDLYNRWFKDLVVVLCPDNDEAGHDFMHAVATSLKGTARTIRWLEIARDLPHKADVTDWFAAGGSADELRSLAEAAGEWAPSPEPQGLAAFPLTDAGNGELFAHLFGDRVRYDWQRGRWLVWGDHRWQPDPNGELFRLAKVAARARWKAAAEEVEDVERREKIARWAVASESEGRLNAAIQRARSEHPIADDGAGWDAQPLLFACSNGIVNLRTGELRDGQQGDRLTMGSSLPYKPDATAPRWLQFLEEILPDPDVREFVRLAIGYSMTGLTREQVWFLCYGSGANGKGTLFDALRWAMGDYAHVMAFSTIERGKEQSIPSDMAALAGKRLVLTSETQEHSRFNEARIKSLTGEDPITARELYQRQFTFQPVLKLWVGVNHKPVVNDDSYGFWRRVRLIPFTQTFGPDRADDSLRDQLKTELVGILAWCIKAAIEYCEHGLSIPPAVALATVEYREESDILGPFIADRCAVREEATVMANALYRAYKAWCEAQGMREREIMSATAFGRRIGERFRKSRKNAGLEYLGIGLIADGWDPNPTPSVGLGESGVYSEGFFQKSKPLQPHARAELPEKPTQPYNPTQEPGSPAETACACDTCGCPDEACSPRPDGLWHCDQHHPMTE
jgi:putative DNA primase/helicase